MSSGSITDKVVPALGTVEQYVRGSNIERQLLELVRLRTSMMNGCAYCVDMHSKDARAGGESEQWLYALNAWREAPFFTARERTALARTEAVTEVNAGHVPVEVYRLAREHLDKRQFVDLTMAVIANQCLEPAGDAFRAVAGTYQPVRQHFAR